MRSNCAPPTAPSPTEVAGHADNHPALQVQRLGVRLGGHAVLEQVNFAVEPGTVVALLGPNGAGKTTLLRAITGALRPEFGRCLIDGIDPALDPLAAQARFGYQGDHPPLEDELRVREYLVFHARIRGLPAATIGRRVDEVLATVDLGGKHRALIGTLSRGQRSRLALAEALLHRPPLLILDEPASGLDPAQVVALRQVLRELAGERTILMATHHLAEAEAVCDAVVVLVGGRVRYQGALPELAADGGLEAGYLALAGAGA